MRHVVGQQPAIAVDPRLTTPLPGDDPPLESADDVMSRLIFRPHPNMVRAAWVRGRLLDGPPGLGTDRAEVDLAGL